jgi:predicted nucleic acid-binding protein
MRHNPAVVGRARAYLLEHRQFTISVITRYEILRGLKAKSAATRAQLRIDYADGKTLYLCARSGLYRMRLNIPCVLP